MKAAFMVMGLLRAEEVRGDRFSNRRRPFCGLPHDVDKRLAAIALTDYPS
jgi:hypothetical protein